MTTNTTEKITFRLAAVDDADALAQLINAAYLAEKTDTSWTSERDYIAQQRTTAQDVKAIITTADTVILLAFQHESLAGCANLVNKGDYAYFGLFAVNPRQQAAGIGKQLLSACEDWARHSWQLPAMQMRVINHRAELLAWYQRRGYYPTGQRDPFVPVNVPLNPDCPADTCFVVLSKPL
jgi:GNAT superfamily N-acetyltransferase